ncbi:MAG: 2-C-methyl-D-erythritol 4-phosphate cytidylyltransferase, partial [Deltaproteobacteria bacterium]|nr:2-C-methyl-D-erythritol 4-phosphate cytidylyltransferase [Deltaproteobacteria bacterium]
MEKNDAGAIISAAGLGERFGGDTPKQLLPLNGDSVLVSATRPFLRHPLVKAVVVVVPVGKLPLFEEALAKDALNASSPATHSHTDSLNAPLESEEPRGLFNKLTLVEGASTRGESVVKGLRALPSSLDYVLIHDGVRPFVSEDDITRVLDAAFKYGASVLAAPVTDTLKRGKDGLIVETIPREGLWLAQTPQAFARGLLEWAYREFEPKGATDESSLVERLGAKVALVTGDISNIKITHRNDMSLAKALELGKREMERPGDKVPFKKESDKQRLSVGSGWDFHRFVPGKELYLGCVRFGGEMGLLGHSDADVLTHALIDALLGGAALGDIGEHFPDSNPEYKDASGERLLKATMELLRPSYSVVNVDITLIGERPKVSIRR